MALKLASIQSLSGTTPTWSALYKFAKITASGNVAITISGVGSPDGGVLHFKQDSTGGRELTINTTAVTVDGAAGAVTRVEWSYDGTDYVYTSSFSMASGSSANITPSAPTSGVVDDLTNTFSFTESSGYTVAAGDYEYSVNGGAYAAVTANPIPVGDVAIAIGQLKVRVKAATGRNASAALTNTQAFHAGFYFEEFFDSVTAPAIPSTLTVSGGVTVADATAQTTPNILQFTEDATVKYLYCNSLIDTAGTKSIRVIIRAGATSGLTQFSLIARSSVKQFSGMNSYVMTLNQGYTGANATYNGVMFQKYTAGTGTWKSPTTSPFKGNGIITLGEWYEMRLDISGTSTVTIACVLRRLSDGKYLTTTNTWATDVQGCITYTDSSSPITGSGYFGLYMVTEANNATPTNKVDNITILQL